MRTLCEEKQKRLRVRAHADYMEKKRWLGAGSMGSTRLEELRGRTTWKQRSAGSPRNGEI